MNNEYIKIISYGNYITEYHSINCKIIIIIALDFS